MSPQVREYVSLELAKRIAGGLAQHPEWVALARDNLDRWMRLNADAPGLMRCYEEWRDLIERPVPEICALLIETSERGQRLRRNSPFAGALSPSEVWSIKRRYRAASPV
jgi:hypothetical protein